MIAAQLGVVGTTEACAPAQLLSLHDLLIELVSEGTWELHIADSHGVAQQAHDLWRAMRQRVVVHPSRGDGERPRLDHEETRPVLPVRERDMALVRECQALIVVPTGERVWEDLPVYSSARRWGLALMIVRPDGCVQQWTHGLAPLIPEGADAEAREDVPGENQADA